MITFRNGLLCGLMAIGIAVLLQISFLAAEAGEAAAEIRDRVAMTAVEATSTLAMVRGREPTYYDTASAAKATSRAAFIAARNLARAIEHLEGDLRILIANTDDREKVLLDGSVIALQKSHAALDSVALNVEKLGYQGELALAAAKGTALNLEALAGQGEWRRLPQELLRASESSAQAAANVRDATESLRLATEPLRRLPGRRLPWRLRWLLGLPKVTVR